MADISSHVSSYSTTRCPILPGLTEQMSLANSTFDWRTITMMRVFQYGVAPAIAYEYSTSSSTRRVRDSKVGTCVVDRLKLLRASYCICEYTRHSPG
ncbi:hypothetical protein GGI42DRAFT_333131 [Trichoderma sp. SZMC 28013]